MCIFANLVVLTVCYGPTVATPSLPSTVSANDAVQFSVGLNHIWYDIQIPLYALIDRSKINSLMNINGSITCYQSTGTVVNELGELDAPSPTYYKSVCRYITGVTFDHMMVYQLSDLM
jgi:hypothetical protein